MFLNELNKDESMAFINLVKQFAIIDDVFAKEEKELIEDYINELELVNVEIPQYSIEEVISVFKSSSDKVKRVVLFELAGLSLIDGSFDDKEIEFVEDITKKLGVSKNRVTAFFNYFINLSEVYKFTTVEYESKIELLKEEAEELLK